MLYELFNRNTKCLVFDLDDMYMHVVNNYRLPYALMNYITDTDLSSKDSIKRSLHHINVLRDWLANRVLSLSRENAKVILNVTNLPQTLKTDDRLKIVIACRAMNMEDSFWLRKENENLEFQDVHIRNHSLSEKSYDVAILGHHISATANELQADLSTTGLFPKYWKRENNNVYMLKTDNIGGAAVAAELCACRILEQVTPNVICYNEVEIDHRKFTKSLCIADDQISLVHAQEILDYCTHTGCAFEPGKEFADMVVCDYVVANTDRHNENWGFTVLNTTNTIDGCAPLYDFNQCLLADKFGTNIDDLVYEPTGLTFKDSIAKYARKSSVNFDHVELPKKCLERWNKVKSLK